MWDVAAMCLAMYRIWYNDTRPFRSVTMGQRVRGHGWSACMADYPNISVVRMAVAIQVSKVDIAKVILVQPAAKMPGLKSPLCVPFLSLNWEIERFTVPLSTLISWRYGRLQTVSGAAKLCWAENEALALMVPACNCVSKNP